MPLVTIIGAGILGLWQAFTLARAGHTVRVYDKSVSLGRGASALAGAMVAPDCEAEAAPALVRDLGYRGLALWRSLYPRLRQKGTLVVAPPRNQGELRRFARLTQNHETLSAAQIAALEPALAGRFEDALFFPGEAHMAPLDAMAFLKTAAENAGATFEFGRAWAETGTRPEEKHDREHSITIDCRGSGARDALRDLRGVRGERLLIFSRGLTLARPVRLLHPRHPLYVVPWGGGRFVVGATAIESEDEGPATVWSALELLSLVYALHPAFGEAQILEIASGVRPAFPDNIPRVFLEKEGGRLYVNGAYRHGFLLAPVLAEAVAEFLTSGKAAHPLLRQEGTIGEGAIG